MYLIGKNECTSQVRNLLMYGYDWKLKLPFWLDSNICISQFFRHFLDSFVMHFYSHTLRAKKKGSLQMKHFPFMFATGVGRFSPSGKNLLFLVSIFTLFDMNLFYENLNWQLVCRVDEHIFSPDQSFDLCVMITFASIVFSRMHYVWVDQKFIFKRSVAMQF